MSGAHLTVQNLTTGYHGFQVLQDLSLQAAPGVTVIVGPNGAGKTTLLKALAGLLPRTGTVALDGSDLPAMNATACVQRGLALVAEGRQLFPQMTVTENLELGGWLVPSRVRAERLHQAFEDFPRLKERATQLAGTMSGGEQQMVAMARAMMSGPRLLMLDEPSLGLAPLIVREVLQVVSSLRDLGVTVLLVEQNARAALQVADRAYVLEMGAVALSGAAADLLHDRRIIDTYLGLGAKH